MGIGHATITRFDPTTACDRLLSEVEDLVRRSWGEPGQQVRRWFETARLGFEARDREDRLVGVAFTRRVREDAVWTISTVIDPDLRRSGLAIRLNVAPILDVYSTRIRKNWRNLPRPIFLINRTSNPRVYRLLSHRAIVFPTVRDDPPEPVHLDLFRRVCALSSGASADERTFVLHGASLPYPGLIPRRESLPWSGDREIDSLFRDRLELEDEKGNLLFVTAKFHPLVSIWYAAKKQAVRFVPRRSRRRAV